MTFRSIWKRLTGMGLSLIIWIALSQPFWAQRITGDIIGTITDTTGSAIPTSEGDSAQPGHRAIAGDVRDGHGRLFLRRAEARPVRGGGGELGIRAEGRVRRDTFGGPAGRVDIALSVGLLTSEVK